MKELTIEVSGYNDSTAIPGQVYYMYGVTYKEKNGKIEFDEVVKLKFYTATPKESIYINPITPVLPTPTPIAY